MPDADLGTLLQEHTGELKSIAEATEKGEHEKVVDGVAELVLTLATGNPIVGALAPFARRAVAKAFGESADEMFRRELAAMQRDEERAKFLGQIDEVVASLVGQALVQIVTSQHHVKDEVVEALGGVRDDLAEFRRAFEVRVSAAHGDLVTINAQLVESGAIGIRVRSTATKTVALEKQVVKGKGSVGIELE
jgi:hypothetical protein